MSRFAAYATSAAFNVSLSRPMVVALAAHKYPKYRDVLYENGHAWTTVGALLRRGLIERGGTFPSTDRSSRRRKLTREGELVLELCLLAGLLDKSLCDEAVDHGFEYETAMKVPSA